MTTEQLETFVLLTKIKNFTQTAENLFVAQSTVTNRINELEKELHYPLFIRQRNQLTLTEEGTIFLSYAQRLLDLERSAVRDLNQQKKFQQSKIIGTTHTIYDCYLEEVLINEISNNTELQVKVIMDHSMRLIEMLQDKIIDTAYTYIPYEKHNMKCTLFQKDQLVLVSSMPRPDGIKLAQLPSMDYIYCDFPFQKLGSYIRDLFPANHPFRLELDQSKQIIAYLKAGIGCSFLPKKLVQKSLDCEELYEIPLLDFKIPVIESFRLTL